MSLRSTSLLLFATLLSLGACERGGGGTPPEDGGEYRAVLESPFGAEGAAAIELTGAGILSITTTTGRIFTQSAGTTAHVVLVQEPAGSIEFRVTTAEGQAPPAARVVEVADGNDQPRASLAGYRVTFSR
jgi:hypothetical protein